MSEYSHILRCWGLGLQFKNLGGHSSGHNTQGLELNCWWTRRETKGDELGWGRLGPSFLYFPTADVGRRDVVKDVIVLFAM